MTILLQKVAQFFDGQWTPELETIRSKDGVVVGAGAAIRTELPCLPKELVDSVWASKAAASPGQTTELTLPSGDRATFARDGEIDSYFVVRSSSWRTTMTDVIENGLVDASVATQVMTALLGGTSVYIYGAHRAGRRRIWRVLRTECVERAAVETVAVDTGEDAKDVSVRATALGAELLFIDGAVPNDADWNSALPLPVVCESAKAMKCTTDTIHIHCGIAPDGSCQVTLSDAPASAKVIAYTPEVSLSAHRKNVAQSEASAEAPHAIRLLGAGPPENWDNAQPNTDPGWELGPDVPFGGLSFEPPQGGDADS